jgi:predicted permease
LLLTGGSWFDPLTIQTARRFTTEHNVEMNAVGPGFFATMRIPLLAGRGFDEHDSRPIGETGRRSVIVNQAFVDRYLAGHSPLGVRIGIGARPETKTDIEIVGVVGDISYRDLREQSEEAWFPIFEGDDSMGTFYVRVRGTPEQAFQTIRRIVHQADPQLSILAFRTVNEQVGRSLSTERLLAALSVSFGALALLLSLIGLYGVMSFVVTRRTREIGIRLALGATGASAIRLVLRDAVAMIAGGIAIALPCVAALGKLVQSQLFGVTATDPATVAAAAAVLAAGALAAAFIPAWRASKVNPTDALRLD